MTTRDRLGAVFVPLKGQRPAYSYGPEESETRDLMFTCPKSAIPDLVWELLAVWNSCRLMQTLPAAGGLLDQPVLVQRYFPLFDMEMRTVEAIEAKRRAEAAAVMVGTIVVKALTGR